jgi:hypothetical protein
LGLVLNFFETLTFPGNNQNGIGAAVQHDSHCVNKAIQSLDSGDSPNEEDDRAFGGQIELGTGRASISNLGQSNSRRDHGVLVFPTNPHLNEIVTNLYPYGNQRRCATCKYAFDQNQCPQSQTAKVTAKSVAMESMDTQRNATRDCGEPTQQACLSCVRMDQIRLEIQDDASYSEECPEIIAEPH